MRGSKWDNDDLFRERFIRAHRKWKNDWVWHGRNGIRRPFCVHYLYVRAGLGRPTHLLRGARRFDEVIALCPPEVLADWQPRSRWVAWSIEAKIRDIFATWQTDEKEGQPAGKPWCRRYIERHGGSNMLQSLDSALPVDIFIRRLGGEIEKNWVCRYNRWSTERGRELFLVAHAAWLADDLRGKPAGKKFNISFLIDRGHLSLVAGADSHVHGGLQALARRIPEIAADWSYRRSLSISELARELVGIHRLWRRDPRGRLCGRMFGRSYLELVRWPNLYALLRSKRRLFSRKECRAATRDWARRLPGAYTPEIRRRLAQEARGESCEQKFTGPTSVIAAP